MFDRVFRGAIMFLVLSASFASASSSRADKGLEHRFVFSTHTLKNDAQTAQVVDLVERASAHGYTALVLSAAFDRILLQPPQYFERLEKVSRACRDHGMALIPLLFSPGYAGVLLENDAALAAVVPLRGEYHNGGELTPLASEAIVHAGFEAHDGNRATEVIYQDGAGTVSFIDTTIASSGNASLRFEASDSRRRASFAMTLLPFHSYRVRCRFRTDSAAPASGFELQVWRGQRTLLASEALTASAGEWHTVEAHFNSLDGSAAILYAGIWSPTGGRFWIDDVTVEDAGLVNVFERNGAPAIVRPSGNRDVVGVDVAIKTPPSVPRDYKPSSLAAPLGIGSAVDVVSFEGYQVAPLRNGQVCVCLSQEALYETVERIVGRIKDVLEPTAYFLSVDEYRAGGWCMTCQARGVSAGQLIGDAIARAYDIVQERSPGAEVFVWSDMLDPNQNARDDFWLVNGDIAGSWQYVPTEVIIACWQHSSYKASLAHFSELGFRTLACVYYDSGSLASANDWVQEMPGLAGGYGVMYTTWRADYSFLETFGDTVDGPD